MDKPYTSTRIWRSTLDKLRLIGALTGKSIVAVIDELADARLKELERQTGAKGLSNALKARKV